MDAQPGVPASTSPLPGVGPSDPAPADPNGPTCRDGLASRETTVWAQRAQVLRRHFSRDVARCASPHRCQRGSETAVNLAEEYVSDPRATPPGGQLAQRLGDANERQPGSLGLGSPDLNPHGTASPL